jgi:hypothetical protein
MAPVAVFAATEQLSRLAFATAREEPKETESEEREPAGDVTPALEPDGGLAAGPVETTNELDEEPAMEPPAGDGSPARAYPGGIRRTSCP